MFFQHVGIFQHAEKTFGKVDIAINTVGKVLKKPIAEISEEEFDSMADVNAKSIIIHRLFGILNEEIR